MAKTHIMRFAPQDYRTSRTRARSIQTRDPLLRVVYLEALFALYEAGGSLSADPELLADELGLPAREIARRLPILDAIARSGSGRGGLLIEDGRITNGRVTADLLVEHEYKNEQRERGRRGGEAKAASARLAAATDLHSPTPPSIASVPPPMPPSYASASVPPPAASSAGGSDADGDERRYGSPGEAERVRSEIGAAKAAAAAVTGRPAGELVTEASRTSRGKSFHDEADCPSVPWLRKTLEKLITIRFQAQAEQRDRPPPAANPRAQERRAGMEALIQGGLDGKRGVGRGNAGPGRELPERGSGPRGPEGEGRGLPPGTGEPE